MNSDRTITNLSLTGFMGVGKSTLGRFLASSLRYDFVDTDELIESRTGTSITDIFETKGEAYFRQMEHELVEEMASWKKKVISTGGGLVTKNNNLDSLKLYSFVVCLWASPETIYSRVRRQQHRPLLQTENPVEKICQLLEERAPFYKKSDLIVNTDRRPLRVVGQLVTKHFHEALSKGSKARIS